MHEGNKALFDLVWVFVTVRKLKTEEVEQMLEAFQCIQNLTPPIPVDMIDFGLDILLELWRSKLHDGKTDRTSWLNI